MSLFSNLVGPLIQTYVANVPLSQTSVPTPAPSPAPSSSSSNSGYSKPSQTQLNNSLQAAKQEWWDAKFKGDQAAMDAAAQKGAALRSQGAQETEATRKLDETNTAKLQATKQTQLNTELEKAKADYWTAQQKGDQAGMNAAAERGEILRNNGAQETNTAKQIDQDNKNRLLLESKRAWWEARLTNNQAAMDAASKQGATLRSLGAQETAATAQLDKEYLDKLHKKEAQAAATGKQNQLNADLLKAKTDWWIARLRDNDKDMDAAAKRGDLARKNGAAETDASREVDRKYGALLQEKLSNESKLLEQKKRWWDARLNLDSTTMAKAETESAALRAKAYVNDHTAAMVRLDTQNQLFFNAQRLYYDKKMNLDTAGMQAQRNIMETAERNGASLSQQKTYRLETANDAIIGARIQYWQERFEYNTGSANAIRARENAIRGSYGAMSNYLISNNGYEFDRTANNILHNKEERWNAYAKLTKKEAEHWDPNGESIQTDLRKIAAAMGKAVLGSSKVDRLNEEIVSLRKGYWSAVDRYADPSVYWNRLQSIIKSNGGLNGLLKTSAQDTANAQFKAARDAMNTAIGHGKYDDAIHDILVQQSITAAQGSDLSIRRAGGVSQASVDALLIHIRKSEWNNLVNLASPDSRLAKAKVSVIANLKANENNANLKDMELRNQTILSAKRDYWTAAAGMSTSGMARAMASLTQAASGKNASLTASMNTAVDGLFRDAIELDLKKWADKGNGDQQDDIGRMQAALTQKLNLAKSRGLGSYVSRLDEGTALDRALASLYNNKKAQWESLANHGMEIPPLQVSIKNQTQSIANVLNAANKLISKDLSLPEFAMDKANRQLLFDRDEILDAIDEGDRAKAQAYFNNGRYLTSRGATLDIGKLVPDLSKVNWSGRDWQLQLNKLAAQYNKEANPADIRSMQKSLHDLGLYQGSVTGRYDGDLVHSVMMFQALLEQGVVGPAPKGPAAFDGKATPELAAAAQKAQFKTAKSDLSFYKMLGGIAEGAATEAYDQAKDIAEMVNFFNPTSLSFYTKTAPMLIDFTKKLANGDINGKEIAAALGDGLKEEFIAPFARIEQFGKKAANGSVTYAESKQFGRDLVKAVEAVATAVTIGGAAAAKMAKAVPGLVEKLKGFGEESLERIKKKLQGTDRGGKPNLYDEAGNYTGGRTQKELDDLAGDPSHGGAIRDQGIKEREIGLALEEQGKLGKIVRDPQGDGGAEFIDTISGIKWDIKSFESYPNGHTSPKKGAFTVENGMKSINKELSKNYNVIVDTRNLVPEHVSQLKEAVREAGIPSRIIWFS